MNAICPNGHITSYRHTRGTRMAEMTCPRCGSGGLRRALWVWCEHCPRDPAWSKYPTGHYVAPDATTCPNGHPIDPAANPQITRQRKRAKTVHCAVCGRARRTAVIYAPYDGVYSTRGGVPMLDGRTEVALRRGDPICWLGHNLVTDGRPWLRKPPDEA